MEERRVRQTIPVRNRRIRRNVVVALFDDDLHLWPTARFRPLKQIVEHLIVRYWRPAVVAPGVVRSLDLAEHLLLVRVRKLIVCATAVDTERDRRGPRFA